MHSEEVLLVQFAWAKKRKKKMRRQKKSKWKTKRRRKKRRTVDLCRNWSWEAKRIMQQNWSGV